MGTKERYHAPPKAAYLKLKEELPILSKNNLISTAVKATNDSINPEVLVTTLLVFGAMPWKMTGTPAETQVERARAVDKARDEVSKELAKSKFSFVCGTRGQVPKRWENVWQAQR
jgi:hypothetical protein